MSDEVLTGGLPAAANLMFGDCSGPSAGTGFHDVHALPRLIDHVLPEGVAALEERLELERLGIAHERHPANATVRRAGRGPNQPKATPAHDGQP